MSNEMDLHTSTDTPNSGLDRVLVYYYAALFLFSALFIFRMENGVWRNIFACAVLLMAIIPPILSSHKKRKLRDVRAAQLAEHRKSKTHDAAK